MSGSPSTVRDGPPMDRIGRTVEFWGEDDTLGLCLQLGLIDPASLPADMVGDLPERHRW